VTEAHLRVTERGAQELIRALDERLMCLVRRYEELSPKPHADDPLMVSIDCTARMLRDVREAYPDLKP